MKRLASILACARELASCVLRRRSRGSRAPAANLFEEPSAACCRPLSSRRVAMTASDSLRGGRPGRARGRARALHVSDASDVAARGPLARRASTALLPPSSHPPALLVPSRSKPLCRPAQPSMTSSASTRSRQHRPHPPGGPTRSRGSARPRSRSASQPPRLRSPSPACSSSVSPALSLPRPACLGSSS